MPSGEEEETKDGKHPQKDKMRLNEDRSDSAKRTAAQRTVNSLLHHLGLIDEKKGGKKY